MRTRVLLPLLVALTACHGFFGDRTDEEDVELSSFAEARQRAATFYDGGDYVRAAAQYREALKLRENHFATHLGLSYSLMYTNQPSTLLEAEKEFLAIGERRDPKEEVKRVFGLGLTYRSLASHHQRRSRLRDQKGQVKGSAEDAAAAIDYAQKGLDYLKKVMDLDLVLANEQAEEAKRKKLPDAAALEPFRVTASLTPDAHLGMAHCEILLMDPSRPDELAGHVASAREHLTTYATIAANARKFWELQREQRLVIDPLNDQPQTASMDAVTKQRYEQRIANTIKQEVYVRRVLLETLLFANLFPDAIQEANTILELDPQLDEVVRTRARAYLFLTPPDYRAALRDLKDYRSRLPMDRLTDELVQINREIRKLESEIEKASKEAPPVAREG
jgi:hypothetical protein